MNGKTTALASLCSALLLFVVLPASLVVAADPCHVFHKPLAQILPHGFSPLTSCQLAGLVNNYLADEGEHFDSVILGTSLSENFRPEYFAQRMKLSRTLKLTMVGMVPREIHALARHALATGRAKRVFWEISPHFFHMQDIRSFDDMEKKGRVPPYLYNKGRIDDYRYVFNITTFSSTLDILLGNDWNYGNNIDRIGYWEGHCDEQGICDQFYTENQIEQIRATYQPITRQLQSPKEKQHHDYQDFDRFVMDTINEHCNTETEFDLFFPPISLLWYARLSAENFAYELYMPRHVLEKTRHCHNVRIFSFMNDISMTADLSNYHDPRHFYGDMHDRIVDAMANGLYEISSENIDNFEQKAIENINAYTPFSSKRQPH